ncbi:hypothetical protein KSP39_PZI022516 [Platanthera zijinensis]|uniref:Uncharacterized protein n=1 Tax=Platanthera zijinensis TaxID=2320716 RepID=A0AAP0AWD0_9ASPA
MAIAGITIYALPAIAPSVAKSPPLMRTVLLLRLFPGSAIYICRHSPRCPADSGVPPALIRTAESSRTAAPAGTAIEFIDAFL